VSHHHHAEEKVLFPAFEKKGVPMQDNVAAHAAFHGPMHAFEDWLTLVAEVRTLRRPEAADVRRREKKYTQARRRISS
jgi:hemerythrin-like domain-containing protein